MTEILNTWAKKLNTLTEILKALAKVLNTSAIISNTLTGTWNTSGDIVLNRPTILHTSAKTKNMICCMLDLQPICNS